MISIHVTRAELVARNACSEGLELFDAWFPGGIWASEWTWLHSVWLSIGETRSYAGWLRDEGIVPMANLREVNIRGADLTGANIYGAYLTRADITGANLTGAYLIGANLTGAYLTGANLTGAYLYGAKLTGANLYGAYRSASDPAILGWVVVDGQLRRAVTVPEPETT